jgi:glycosyltransferase involved in cell wall biosynthesis
MLSICIPTYNRARYLSNCLHSIATNLSQSELDFEICISDNCSTDETEKVVRIMQKKMAIKYQKNSSNLGIPRNFINVVAMAKGQFVWLIGDDDLLLPYALIELLSLIKNNSKVDFFFINSFHLTREYVFSYPQPFDAINLPEKMAPFSLYKKSGQIKFLDLIDPKKSFDFLGGMYLSVFRRELWNQNVKALDNKAISDVRIFSHFDNTFPHVKIFSRAFAKSDAYFFAKPLSVCLSGAREWSPMYPMIHSVRLIEALEEYRKNGLPYFQYLRCKNYALNNFLADLAWMILYRQKSGFAYVKLWKILATSCLFPNLYLSIFYYLARKFKKQFNTFKNLRDGSQV